MAARPGNLRGSHLIQGDKELRRLLGELGGLAEKRALQAATNYAMTPIKEAAEASAPVGTEVHDLPRRKGDRPFYVAPGHLKRSIVKVNVTNKWRYLKRRGMVGTAVGPSKDAWYGKFLEYGTSRMPAQPWLRRTFYKNRREVRKRFNEQLFRRVKKLMPGLSLFRE